MVQHSKKVICLRNQRNHPETVARTDDVVRYHPDARRGLSQAQVDARVWAQLCNYDTTVPTKSVGTIVRENVCTLFNLINAALALAVLSVGSYKNMLFMGVVLCNLLIGIVQEIRAKRAIDRLSLIHAARATIIRDGEELDLPIQEIVLDDVLLLRQGNQTTVDCIVLEGRCEVDESFITGEPDAILKEAGDTILSGSVILSGTCRARADRIADDTYIASISREAKYYKKTDSEIMHALNRIIGAISVIILPIGLVLLHNQLGVEGNTYSDAVVQTVAALIGMIPEGLVLLTSTVLALSVVRLARQQVMVQDLYCIEALARVDTICLDKTGTLTKGELQVTDLIPAADPGAPAATRAELTCILQNLTAAIEDSNATFTALRGAYPPQAQWPVEEVFPFSSRSKWSAATFSGRGTYILGAAEFVCPQLSEPLRAELRELSDTHRVLLLAHTCAPVQRDRLPEDVTPCAFICLKDLLRTAARQTLEYFVDQEIDLKVISGDSARTVSGIARDAGVPDWDNAIDMTEVRTPEQLYDAAERYTVFGRVTPEQKKDLVQAMQRQGHHVAMTGDGVNDVLALKQSDCSIAMAAGTDAARNVSQLVLLESNFDSLPQVLWEGRRSINNIQRSASLFLVKTIYATLFAVIFLFVQQPYPFIPIQLTLLSCLTIGIPSFLLALEPNRARVSGRFLFNILSKALPGGLTIVVNLLLLLFFSDVARLSPDQVSTLCVVLTGFTGFLVLGNICQPFHPLRLMMYLALIAVFVLALVLLPGLFSVVPLGQIGWLLLLCLIPVDFSIFCGIFWLIRRLTHAA